MIEIARGMRMVDADPAVFYKQVLGWDNCDYVVEITVRKCTLASLGISYRLCWLLWIRNFCILHCISVLLRNIRVTKATRNCVGKAGVPTGDMQKMSYRSVIHAIRQQFGCGQRLFSLLFTVCVCYVYVLFSCWLRWKIDVFEFESIQIALDLTEFEFEFESELRHITFGC